MRLSGLLGLTVSDTDNDRVRALVARAALDREDGPAACEILSAAIMRRNTTARRPSSAAAAAAAAAEAAEASASAFAAELCETIDLIVDRQIQGAWMTGVGGGSGSNGNGDGERGFSLFDFGWVEGRWERVPSAEFEIEFLFLFIFLFKKIIPVG